MPLPSYLASSASSSNKQTQPSSLRSAQEALQYFPPHVSQVSMVTPHDPQTSTAVVVVIYKEGIEITSLILCKSIVLGKNLQREFAHQPQTPDSSGSSLLEP
jgi:hypothetical protein